MPALPCKHETRITEQVQPTIDLLSNMDDLHPDILRLHDIEPIDYKSGLVFRSAIESIRGQFIASSTTGREGLVRDILVNLQQRDLIAEFERSSSRSRYDFVVAVKRDPDYFAALEVKDQKLNNFRIWDSDIIPFG